MLVIPAIDVLDGKVVRLRRGSRDDVTIYGEVDVFIEKFMHAGIKRIHIVDLDAAFGMPSNLSQRLLKYREMNFQVGGGFRSYEKIRQTLDSTSFDVVVGSLLTSADESTRKSLAKLDTSRIIAALDVLPVDGQYLIKDDGWRRETNRNVFDVIEEFRSTNFRSYLVTDISRDGVLVGPNLLLYEALKKGFPGIHLIASGGVSHADDFSRLGLSDIQSVVVGKALYENTISISEVLKWQQ